MNDLSIPSQGTLKISGSSVVYYPNIYNYGIIESTATTVTTTINSFIVNKGVFNVKAGKCVVQTFYQESGNLTIENQATFKHNNNSLGLVLNGILNGNGIVDSVSTTVKYLSPGFSPGKMQFIGDLTLPLDSTYLIEIYGIENFDYVTVSGKSQIFGKMLVKSKLNKRLM
jgi:hypothetical protein